MSMYAEILSHALDDWVDDLSRDALIEFAQVCRAQILDSSPSRSIACGALSELSYDRALIKLCEAHGIDVNALSFSRPDQERDRLESRLVAIGIDLVALSRDLREG